MGPKAGEVLGGGGTWSEGMMGRAVPPADFSLLLILPNLQCKDGDMICH